MGNFLCINSVPLAVLDGSANVEAPEDIGETTRAFGGDIRRSRQALKQVISGKTPPLTQQEARAWRSLLLGLGQHWSFDSSLYSAKGLGPNAGYVASQVTGAGSKFGAGYLSVNATTGAITFPAALGSIWTVLVWRDETPFRHYTVRSDGQKWLDGSTTAVSTSWLSVNGSGDVSLANTGGSAVKYDDLVALPFLVPSSWVPYLAAATSAFSDLPKLTATGDIIETSSLTVIGDIEASRVLGAWVGGSFDKTQQQLSFKLREA